MARFRKDSVPPPLRTYGLDDLGYDVQVTGDRDSDQLWVELVCFRIAHRRREGGLGKFGHFKNAVDLLYNNERRPVPTRFIWCRESEKILRSCCKYDELGVAGPTSLGKSAPLALWAVINYAADPTHTKVLVMSTTKDGAKKRIWRNIREFIDALPNYKGKPLWGTNRISGPTYDFSGFGESSGIYLMAGEKGKEKDALDNLIGIKAARTGDPDDSYEALKKRPEFRGRYLDLPQHEHEDLLKRLARIAPDRAGRIIFIVDEATGIVESVLNAYLTNMRPGNSGNIQCIMIGNPNLHWDVFGLFCEPSDGWDKVTLRDYEWPTRNGGWCIRFSAEESSLIKDKDKRCGWMMSKEDIDRMIEKYGRNSLMVYRFVHGFWCPEGADFGVYSQGDVEKGMGKTTWAMEVPTLHSTLDPAFAAGGDKPAITITKYGTDLTGKKVMEVVTQEGIKIDADSETPIPYQVVRKWKMDCIKRNIPPDRAAFDSTGGGVVFAGIVKEEWSGRVQAISSGGKATTRVVGNEKDEKGEKLKAHQRFANRATEVWYGAHPFLRSGQIFGITTELAKEICSRRHADKRDQSGRSVQVEDKKTYKKREGSSPDDADSFFLAVEHLRTRFGFRAVEKAGDAAPSAPGAPVNSAWEVFKKRARKISVKTNLPRV